MRGTLEAAFDRITALAARLFQTPIAVVSLIEADRVRFESHFGLTIGETPRDGSPCVSASESNQVTVLTDASASVGGVLVRFYAAAPLISAEGQRLGTVAVMDTRNRATLTSDERATLADLAGVVVDHLRAPEAAAAPGEAGFRAFMESASQGIVAIDRRGRIALVNRQAEELFGYCREEMIGHELEMLLPEALRAGHEAHRKGYFGSPHPRPMGIGLDLSGRRKNGEQFSIEISLNYVEIDGKALAMAFITDISERLRLEAQLRQSQKMEAIGQLAGGVAHDFNNLLTVIQGYAAMSLEGLDPADPSHEPFVEIEKASVSAAGLTRQLLAFSRRQVVQPRVIGLNTTITQVEKMLRRVIGEDVELVLATGEGLYDICADPGLVEQILMNLAVNARDAMPEGGRLILETANLSLDKEYVGAHLAVKTGPHAMLAVSDTGVGMSEEVRARIFEPFFTTKPQGQGTGLGLATVYGIVKQLDGTIWVYSEPGKGTTFKILFPAARPEDVRLDESRSAAPAPTGRETILLVEDEEGVRRFVHAMLERQGYQVLDAADVDHALQIADDPAAQFDLLLTDVIMPRMNGPELARKICAQRPKVRVLYMSGYTDRAIRLQDQIGGGTNFIQKPFTPASLAEKLRELLSTTRSGDGQLQ
jgi:two-component system, cell cycle sensor histidine kinase and response regulator CckA